MEIRRALEMKGQDIKLVIMILSRRMGLAYSVEKLG
jgi:hypothetical protein